MYSQGNALGYPRSKNFADPQWVGFFGMEHFDFARSASI